MLINDQCLFSGLPSSSAAPPTCQDGATDEGAADGEAETRQFEGGSEQHGVRRPPEALSPRQLSQSDTNSKEFKDM